MKFEIKYSNEITKKSLIYVPSEYSFDMKPIVNSALLTIQVNYLNLTVAEDNRIVQVWGYSPYESWEKSSFVVPESKKGNLMVATELEPGFTYGLIKNGEWPIYVNKSTGWVCLGNFEKKEEAIEFISDCIAVVENGYLVSLWLKPQKLPDGL